MSPIYLQVLGDEGVEVGVGDVGVDARGIATGAAIAPRDNTSKLVVDDEGAARVTAAGVLSALRDTGADHAVSDGQVVLGGLVVLGASVTVDDGDLDRLERVGRRADILLLEAPSGDESRGAGNRLLVNDTADRLNAVAKG